MRLKTELHGKKRLKAKDNDEDNSRGSKTTTFELNGTTAPKCDWIQKENTSGFILWGKHRIRQAWPESDL